MFDLGLAGAALGAAAGALTAEALNKTTNKDGTPHDPKVNH